MINHALALFRKSQERNQQMIIGFTLKAQHFSYKKTALFGLGLFSSLTFAPFNLDMLALSPGLD